MFLIDEIFKMKLCRNSIQRYKRK